MTHGPKLRSSCIRPVQESQTVSWIFREQDALERDRDETRLQYETRFRGPALTAHRADQDTRFCARQNELVERVSTVSFFTARSAR